MGKKYHSGLVLGKFMPIQVGHCYLIDTAAEQCDILHLMVCSDDTQPIPGDLRYKWAKEIYVDKPNVKVIWCTDPNPQYPEDCDTVDNFYNKYWVPSVYKYVDKLDVVFTSEEYGDEFARYLGIRHVQVDQPRTHYRVSATMIRNDPFYNWKFIPQVVRPYFTKKVVVLGPESTGKSTLVKKLACHYGTGYVSEYGRTYTEATGTDNLTILDFINIANGHKKIVDDAVSHGDKIIFVDTEAIVTKTFGHMYLDTFFAPEIDDIIANQKYDLYLLTDVDVPWVQDGNRDFPEPENRLMHLNLIKKELEANDIPYVLLSGTYEERFQKAILEINRFGIL